MVRTIEAERIDRDDVNIEPVYVDLMQLGKSFDTSPECCSGIFRGIEQDRPR